MSSFEEVGLTWEGREYVIPADGVLRVIAKVEDVITLGELAVAQKRIPLAKLATAYGVMLRAAGADVTDEQVYSGMFANGGKDMPRRAMQAALTLQALMIPPEHLRATKPGKGGAATGPAASSRSATGSRSGKAG